MGKRKTRISPTEVWQLPDGTIPLQINADGSVDFPHGLSLAGTLIAVSAATLNDLVTKATAQTIAGIKTFSAMPRIPINADVAAAGSTVTDAAQLSEGFTVVTGANGTLGVKLPATPAPGAIVIIKGTTSGVLKVWPDAAATINAVGSNGAMSLASGVIPAIFIAKTATQWYTLPLLPS